MKKKPYAAAVNARRQVLAKCMTSTTPMGWYTDGLKANSMEVQAFQQQFGHNDMAQNYMMRTREGVCYPGSTDRGTRRTVLWTLYSNHAEMAAFLNLDSTANGSGLSMQLPSRLVTVCMLLFEHWDIPDARGTYARSFVTTRVVTVWLDSDCENTFASKFETNQLTKHVVTGKPLELIIQWNQMQDLESISAKCEIPRALHESFDTYAESFRGELQTYMNGQRKLRRASRVKKKKRRKTKKNPNSGFDPDWTELSRIDSKLARDIDFCFKLTSRDNGVKTAQDCLPDGVVCHFGHACAFTSPTTEQECFSDPICGDLYLCKGCSISLCSAHRRCHTPEHELVLRQRPSAESKELGKQPVAVLKWSVLDVLDHEPDAKHPADINRMKFLINWAGPFKHEWCTLKELGFTLETELVATYLRNNKIAADRLRGLPHNEEIVQNKKAPPQIPGPDEEKQSFTRRPTAPEFHPRRTVPRVPSRAYGDPDLDEGDAGDEGD